MIVARRDGSDSAGADFADLTTGGGDRLPDIRIEPDDLATILYTSGTTGRSKGAMATQRNHITNLMNSTLSITANRVLMGVPEDFVAPQAGSLTTLPFFHIGGITVLCIGTAMGSKLALMYKWNPVEALDLIEEHGLSTVAGVPFVVRQLLDTASASGRRPSSLLGVSAGGAPVPPELVRRINAQFQTNAAAGSAYGLTETTSAVIRCDGEDYAANPTSIGRRSPARMSASLMTPAMTSRRARLASLLDPRPERQPRILVIQRPPRPRSAAALVPIRRSWISGSKSGSTISSIARRT